MMEAGTNVSQYMRPLAWTLVAMVSAALVFHLCSYRHQRRALAEAIAAEASGSPEMTRMLHLARCISLGGPICGRLTDECIERAARLVAGLEGQGRVPEARVSASMIEGALESGGCRSSAGSSIDGAVPGSHPIEHAMVMPIEPWSFLAVLSGVLLVAMLAWFGGLEPLVSLASGRRRRIGFVIVAAGVVLEAAFIACLWMA